MIRMATEKEISSESGDHGGVDQRIFEGLPEQSVGEGGLVVLQAAKVRAEGFVILKLVMTAEISG